MLLLVMVMLSLLTQHLFRSLSFRVHLKYHVTQET